MKKWTRLLALMMSLALIASCCAFAESGDITLDVII